MDFTSFEIWILAVAGQLAVLGLYFLGRAFFARMKRIEPKSFPRVHETLEDAESRVRRKAPPDPVGAAGEAEPSRDRAPRPVPALLPKDLRTCLAVLGLDPASATRAAVEDAYRHAALRNHPDKTEGDPYARARFLFLKDAYEKLLSCYPGTLPEGCGPVDDEAVPAPSPAGSPGESGPHGD